jgi:N-methylhydantoinase A
LEKLDWAKIAALYAEMVVEARGLLLGAGANPADIIYKPAADMRYVGQGFEIPVPMPSLAPGQDDVAAIAENFLAAYRERFGRALDGLPIEALTWRLAASAPGRDIAMEGAQQAEAGEAQRGIRRTLFEGHGWCDCAVYDRYRLAPGAAFAGPALVEERESTCVIPPGAQDQSFGGKRDGLHKYILAQAEYRRTKLRRKAAQKTYLRHSKKPVSLSSCPYSLARKS